MAILDITFGQIRLGFILATPLALIAQLAAAILVGPLATTATAQAPSSRLPELVTPQTVQMIDRGLEWLVRNQRQDGSWSAGGNVSYGGNYPAVMTSLAGLALMANGSTPAEGKYADNVRAAMNFLLSCAEKTRFTKAGRECCVISSETANEFRSMYGHGFGMLFLGECYGCELDAATSARLRRVLEGAAHLITVSQSQLGGWYYSPESNSDEGSVTVTQMQALRSARNGGIKVAKGTIEKAIRYLEISEIRESDGTSGIAYMASQANNGRGQSRPPISAAAIVVLFSGGKYESDAFARRCYLYTSRRWRSDNLYSGHWYYGHFYVSQAFYQQSMNPEFAKDWRDYYPWLCQRLASQQQSEGCWTGDSVGTTYGTAMACLMLQLPYNYLPIFQR